MPPQPEKSPEDLETELKKWPDIFIDKRTLRGKSDPIWKRIKDDMGLAMKPESLCLYVYNRRNPCRSNLEKYFNIQVEPKKLKIDNDTNFIDTFPLNPYNCAPLNFALTIPLGIIICDLKEQKKAENWTDDLDFEIWDSEQLPCAISFKSSWITRDNKFKFKAHCSECKTSFIGESDEIIMDTLTLRIETYATYEIEHTADRQLARRRRKTAKERLLYQEAAEYNEARYENVATPYKPAHLNRTITVRKARQEVRDEHIGYNEIKGLSISDKKFLTICNIRKLSLKPFYLWYWSQPQIDLWNILRDKNLPLSLDSTGSLVKKYQYYENIQTKTAFYYVIVIGLKEKIIPLAQALLSIHHVGIITEFLQRWIEAGAKIPKEITTDGSLALQNSICFSFNKMTFTIYNLNCYKILKNESYMELKCFYRYDIPHLISTIGHWKCLKNSNNLGLVVSIKRAVGYLTQVETLDEFTYIVMSIVIIVNSNLAKDGSECLIRTVKMNNLLRTHDKKYVQVDAMASQINSNKSNEINDEQDNNAVGEGSSENALIKFINDTFDNALKLCTNSKKVSKQSNAYHCPAFTINFKNLCYIFPSWTNVMKKHFASPKEYGTSARSETYFKQLKHVIPYPISAQKFVLMDKKKIKSRTNFGFANLPTTENTMIVEEAQENLFDIDLKELQLSKSVSVDKNEESDKSKRRDVSSEVPEDTDLFMAPGASNSLEKSGNISVDFDNILNSTHIFENAIQRNLVQNGLNFDVRVYCINNSLLTLKFKFTCPFDSIFEILVSAMDDYIFMVELMRYKSSSRFLNFIADYIAKDFALNILYHDRANILFPMYKDAKYSGGSIIDCRDNAVRLFENLITIPSIVQKLVCYECKKKDEDKLIYTRSMSITQFFFIGIHNLQSILEESLTEKMVPCRHCNKSAKRTFEVQSYIAMDIEYLHEETNSEIIESTIKKELENGVQPLSKELCLTSKFSDIPQQINLQKKTFSLKGVLCFEGDSSLELTEEKEKHCVQRHYKSYVFSNEKWQLFNDLNNSIVPVSETPKEKISLLIYTQTEATTR